MATMRMSVNLLKPVVMAGIFSFAFCINAPTHAKNINQRGHIQVKSKGAKTKPLVTREQAIYLKELYENKVSVKDIKNIPEQFELRLKDIEAKSKQQSENTKDIVRTSTESIMEEKKKIADAELAIGANEISQLSLVLAVIALLGGLIFVILKSILVDQVKKEVLRASEEHIIETAHREAAIRKLEHFAILINPFWELYNRSYQKYRRGETFDLEGIKIPLKVAKTLSNVCVALQEDKKMIEYRKNDARARAMYACLLNHYVCHHTAYLTLIGTDEDTEGEAEASSEDIVIKAYECLEMAKRYEIGKFGQKWFDLHETAAFAFIKLGGNHSSQEKGRQIIRDIFNGNKPGSKFEAPTAEWLDRVWTDYCSSAACGLEGIARPSTKA